MHMCDNCLIPIMLKRVLEKQASQQSAKKQKQYSNFADTDRAEIGRYAAMSTQFVIPYLFK